MGWDQGTSVAKGAATAGLSVALDPFILQVTIGISLIIKEMPIVTCKIFYNYHIDFEMVMKQLLNGSRKVNSPPPPIIEV